MSKLRVLLIMAYPQGYSIVNTRQEEIGIEYIAEVTRQRGNELILVYGDETQIDFDEIEEFKPDIVGFTMYYNNVDRIRIVSEKLIGMFNDIIIVAGGPLATMNHKEVLQNEYTIDCVVRGEGEKTWVELLEYIENEGDISKVKGITYRGAGGNEIICNPDQEYIKDLDTLPFPKTNSMIEAVYISTSRGCVKNCSFCISNKFWKRWRGRSPQKVVDEMEYLVNNNGTRYIGIVDNSFEDPDGKCTRGLEIAKEIIRRGVKVVYQVNYRAEFWKVVTPEMMDILKKSGLVAVSIGIETANEFDRKLYNKAATVEDNYKIVEVMQSYGIHVNTNFIMFNPYSTFEGLRQNIDYLEKLNRIDWDSVSHSYMTLEGTDLYKKIKSDGLAIPSVYYNVYYSYKYKDPRMLPLSKYLYNIPHKWLDDHRHLVSGYLSCLTLDRLVYGFHEKRDKYDIVKAYEDEARNLSNTIGRYIAKWFRNLLDIAEHGWDIDKALEMEYEIMNHPKVVDSLDGLWEMALGTNAELRALREQI